MPWPRYPLWSDDRNFGGRRGEVSGPTGLPNIGSEVLRIALEQCCRIVFVFFFPVVGYFIVLDGYRPATSISRADIIEAHL